MVHLLEARKIYPAPCFLPGSDGDCVALLASHVGDFSPFFLKGEETVNKFFQKVCPTAESSSAVSPNYQR